MQRSTGVGAEQGWRIWLAGARPRTLGAAVAPVVAGTAVAFAEAREISAGRALLALAVALAIQVGVNYANDYSDGVRGTDKERAGPVRLTASGLASPNAVRAGAASAFAVAATAGLVLAIIVTPWLLLVGAASIAAAVLYTGGPKPYGYIGLGELMVFVFFGVVATAGSTYVQLERIPAIALWASLAIGLLACAILVTNNLRDIRGDAAAGKRTLAVRTGAPATRWLYIGCVTVAFLGIAPIAVEHTTALVAYAAIPLAVPPVLRVLHGTSPPELVAALVGTARLELVTALLLGLGLWLS